MLARLYKEGSDRPPALRILRLCVAFFIDAGRGMVTQHGYAKNVPEGSFTDNEANEGSGIRMVFSEGLDWVGRGSGCRSCLAGDHDFGLYISITYTVEGMLDK